MLANLAPHKGQQTALRALRILRQRGRAVECWLAGEDRADGAPYEGELHRLVSELGVADHVRFLGYRTDGPELLRSADVFLLPSTHEGLPLSILEAQACRVPVMGTPIPGIAEIVENDRTGFLVAVDDYQGYADRIEQLMSDSSLRHRITDAAASHAVGYVGMLSSSTWARSIRR